MHENMPDAMCQQLGIAAVHNRGIDLRIADFLRAAKVCLAEHRLQMKGDCLMLRFLSCFEKLTEHLRLLPAQHNAERARVFALPSAARWVKLAVQLSKAGTQQLGDLSPCLQAQDLVISAVFVHGDNDHHIAGSHFSFLLYQYSSDNMIVVAERSASVMIRTRVLPLS